MLDEGRVTAAEIPPVYWQANLQKCAAFVEQLVIDEELGSRPEWQPHDENAGKATHA